MILIIKLEKINILNSIYHYYLLREFFDKYQSSDRFEADSTHFNLNKFSFNIYRNMLLK